MLRVTGVLLLAALAVQAQDRIPVVLELFTSEGCSSCPPADELLARLESKQPVANVDVIALSEHVDYWNSLGWKDPFSSHVFSDRQNFYARILHANDVYTPQAVIDGRFSTVGSNNENVRKALIESGDKPKAELHVDVQKDGDGISVQVPSAMKGDLWVAITQARAVSRVAHGENGGRTLQHVGVVRYLAKLSGNRTHIAIDKDWASDLRVVAFVQDGRSGRILQAVQMKI